MVMLHVFMFISNHRTQQTSNCRAIIFKAVALNHLTHTKNSNSPFKTHYPLKQTPQCSRGVLSTLESSASHSHGHNSKRLMLGRPGPAAARKTIKK